MNMHCKVNRKHDIVKNGVIVNHFNHPYIKNNIVGNKSDYMKCFYEFPRYLKPIVNITALPYSIGSKTVNDVVLPFASNTIIDYESEDVFDGDFKIHFGCYKIGKANVKVSISIRIKNDNSINFDIYFTKLCNNTMKGVNLYINEKADDKLISNQGFINPNFNPFNDNLYVDNVGPITYIIPSGKISPNIRHCNLEEDYDNNIRLDDSSTSIKIIFSGESKRYKVNIFCYYNYKYIELHFSFIKDYKTPPIPGFNVLVDDSNIVSQHVIISGGVVNSAYSGNNHNTVAIGRNQQCLVLHFISENGMINITYPTVEGEGIDISILSKSLGLISIGEDIKDIWDEKESIKFIICHQCKEKGINHVKASFDILYTNNKNVTSLPKFIFEYNKECSISSNEYPITITPSIYTSTSSNTYVVKKGKTSAVYLPGSDLVKVHWAELTSKFYIENEEDRKLVINYPKVFSDASKLSEFFAEISLVGYEDEDKITINKESGKIIMEVKYKCIAEGEYGIMIEILVEDTSFAFSWLKICKEIIYSYSVRTGYDSFYYYYNSYKSNHECSITGDVIDNGYVTRDYEKLIDSSHNTAEYYFVYKEVEKLN